MSRFKAPETFFLVDVNVHNVLRYIKKFFVFHHPTQILYDFISKCEPQVYRSP